MSNGIHAQLLANPQFEADLLSDIGCRVLASRWGVGKTFVQKHRAKLKGGGAKPAVNAKPTTSVGFDGTRTVQSIRDRPVTMNDARDWLRSSGDNPDDYEIAITATPYGVDMISNRMSARPKPGKNVTPEPAWPVIQPAAAVNVTVKGSAQRVDRVLGMKLALKSADPQIGFRILDDGTIEPFHDDAAMAVFVEACRVMQPDKITILGDFLDLAGQSRWAQEAGFARTTQMSFDRGHQFLAELRAVCPDAEILLIEGNHDARMQGFIMTNALSAFGLKKANLPDSWPVMSIPSLLRLDDLDVQYVDAYPAATDWDNDLTRNIHGTRANSKGSTMAQYVHELPHVNTWAGHTHRCEIVYRTVIGARGVAVESYAANPGVLCRTDGAVPGVHSGSHSDGSAAKIVEDWQAGFGVLYYNETESWPSVYRIRNGKAIVDGRVISAGVM